MTSELQCFLLTRERAWVVLFYFLFFTMYIQESFAVSEKAFHFLEQPHDGKIMFCKRLRIKGMLDIGIGAVLDLDMASIGLVEMCRTLFEHDQNCFIGDVGLLNLSKS